MFFKKFAKKSYVDNAISNLDYEIREDLFCMQDDIQATIVKLRKEIEKLKNENVKLTGKINEILNEKENRVDKAPVSKSEILKDIQAIQDYSLKDIEDFYRLGE